MSAERIIGTMKKIKLGKLSFKEMLCKLIEKEYGEVFSPNENLYYLIELLFDDYDSHHKYVICDKEIYKIQKCKEIDLDDSCKLTNLKNGVIKFEVNSINRYLNRIIAKELKRRK